MINKNNQNPENFQTTLPQRQLERRDFKDVNEKKYNRPKHGLNTFKKYHNWKQKRTKFIQADQLNYNSNQPILSIAVNCGIKNGINEVLHQYKNPLVDNKIKIALSNKTQNPFEKILTIHKNSKTSCDSKRLTFVNFKTKHKRKDDFLSSSEIRSFKLASKEQRERAKTQPRPFTISFRRTSFPKELTELKQQIEELPVVKKSKKKLKYTLPEAQLESSSPGLLRQNQYNQSMMQSQMNSFQETIYERRLLKQSKNLSIKDYIKQLSEVIAYADSVMQEDDLKEAFDKNIGQNTISYFKQNGYGYRKYWPEHKQYSLNLRAHTQDQDIARFFKNFSYSDPELSEQFQNLVNVIKLDLNHQQMLMNKEIAQSEKKSIEHRFKYKLNFERQNYKRNVRSYLKCKKQYRIQKRRQEVRANGIIRIKKSKRVEKNSQPKAIDAEQD